MNTFVISLVLLLSSVVIPVDKNDWTNNTTELPYTKAVMRYERDDQFIRAEALRIGWGHIDDPCEECVGWAAMPRINDIGRKIEVCNADGLCVGPLFVVDVAGLADLEYLRSVWWGIDISPGVYDILWPTGNSVGTVQEWIAPIERLIYCFDNNVCAY